MTKKHYTQLAKLVSELSKGVPMVPVHAQGYEAAKALAKFVQDLTDYLEAENPNFDRDRFEKAVYSY